MATKLLLSAMVTSASPGVHAEALQRLCIFSARREGYRRSRPWANVRGTKQTRGLGGSSVVPTRPRSADELLEYKLRQTE